MSSHRPELDPDVNPNAGQSLSCPFCRSRRTAWNGWRNSSIGPKHIRICRTCSRRYVPSNAKGMQHTMYQIAFALRQRRRGLSLSDVQKKFTRKFKKKLTRMTINNWEKKYALSVRGTIVLKADSGSTFKTTKIVPLVPPHEIDNSSDSHANEGHLLSFGNTQPHAIPASVPVVSGTYTPCEPKPISSGTSTKPSFKGQPTGARVTIDHHCDGNSPPLVTSPPSVPPQEHKDIDNSLYRRWKDLSHPRDTDPIQHLSGETKEKLRVKAPTNIPSGGPPVQVQPVPSTEHTDEHLNMPMQENPSLPIKQKTGVEWIFDPSLIALPEHVGVTEILGGITGYYISGLAGARVYQFISSLPAFKYQGLVAFVAKTIAEPMVGVFAGSIWDSIGIALGLPVSIDTSRAIVVGSCIRAGADIIDASVGYVADITQQEYASFPDTFMGFGNLRYLLSNYELRHQSNIPQPEILSDEHITSDFCNYIGLGNIIDLTGLQSSSCDEFISSAEMPLYPTQNEI